jgi:hypothetical protein
MIFGAWFFIRLAEKTVPTSGDKPRRSVRLPICRCVPGEPHAARAKILALLQQVRVAAISERSINPPSPKPGCALRRGREFPISAW